METIITEPTTPTARDGMSATDAASVRVLGPADVEEAAVLLARGFDEEPGNRALYPDPAIRRVILETGSRRTLQATIPFGSAYGALIGGQLAALALWHPPGVSTASLGGVLRSLSSKTREAPTIARALPHMGSVMLAAVPEVTALVRARRRAIASASRGASWHLAFLATAPEHRGRGLARALLDRQLRRCDEDGVAAWLETTDPVNPPIYERFGFEIVVHVEDAAWLPGYWAMRREPRSI